MVSSQKKYFLTLCLDDGNADNYKKIKQKILDRVLGDIKNRYRSNI